MKEITTINGSWSDDANGWVSDDVELTGDCWLEILLPGKGRLVIKAAVDNGSRTIWPKALITRWAGPEFRIRVILSDESALQCKCRKIRIITTTEPERIQYANI